MKELSSFIRLFDKFLCSIDKSIRHLFSLCITYGKLVTTKHKEKTPLALVSGAFSFKIFA